MRKDAGGDAGDTIFIKLFLLVLVLSVSSAHISAAIGFPTLLSYYYLLLYKQIYPISVPMHHTRAAPHSYVCAKRIAKKNQWPKLVQFSLHSSLKTHAFELRMGLPTNNLCPTIKLLFEYKKE